MHTRDQGEELSISDPERAGAHPQERSLPPGHQTREHLNQDPAGTIAAIQVRDRKDRGLGVDPRHLQQAALH